MTAPREHRWGEMDARGARACGLTGCTVRVRNSFREWQKFPGGQWHKQHKELIPPCTDKDAAGEGAQPRPARLTEDEWRALREDSPAGPAGWSLLDQGRVRDALDAAYAEIAELKADNARLQKERGAAVADNAALLDRIGDGASVACEGSGSQDCGECGPCLDKTIWNQPHPGAALLEEHRKALVRARNEGLEKARKMAADVGLSNLASVIEAAKEPEQ